MPYQSRPPRYLSQVSSSLVLSPADCFSVSLGESVGFEYINSFEWGPIGAVAVDTIVLEREIFDES